MRKENKRRIMIASLKKKLKKSKSIFFEEKENQKRAGKNLVFFCEKETKVKEKIFLRSSKKTIVFPRLVLRLLV